MAERCIPEECKDDLVNRREVYRLKLMSVTDWDFGQALINLPSAESEPKCNSCRYRNLEWYKEPCDSCTGGGKNCHYKPEPERLTDDDFETIRIHLNALKERLCNQRKWKEAEDYERLINRFIFFASAQPEIIRCKDCKWWGRKDTYKDGSSMIVCKKGRSANPEGFCHYAEMRGEQDETD